MRNDDGHCLRVSHFLVVWYVTGEKKIKKYMNANKIAYKLDKAHEGIFELVELFPGFMDRWTTEGWEDALGTAIWWYAQSNSGSPAVDQGIVTAQIAMECLSYEYCVRERTLVSKQGFEQLWASDRYRLLLRSLDIPIEIPDAAAALTSANRRRKKKWADGPHALTEIRNRLVHGGRKGAQLQGECYVDAWLLATRLLELCMLAICSFKGECWNRMTGVKEPVPWAR